MFDDPFQTYTNKDNRQFRVSGIEKIPNTDKWIGRELKSKWLVIVIFLDNNERNYLYYNYNNKLETYREKRL